MKKLLIILLLIFPQLPHVAKIISAQTSLIATATAEVVEPAIISGRANYNHTIIIEKNESSRSYSKKETAELALGKVTIFTSSHNSSQLKIEESTLKCDKTGNLAKERISFQNNEQITGNYDGTNKSTVEIKSQLSDSNITSGQLSGHYRVTLTYN